MRSRAALATVTALVIAVPAIAAVDVRVNGQSVDIQASNAPLSEILDRLSRQTQMRIVYDGMPPRQVISLDLRGRTPVEAVTAALEGQGVNYAMAMDPTGTRVETLLVSGSAPSSAGSRPAGQPDRRSFPQEAVQEPGPEEPEPVAEDEGAIPPDSSGGVGAPVPQGKEVQPEVVAPPESGVGGFSASPFAPSAPPPQPPPQPQATPPPFNP